MQLSSRHVACVICRIYLALLRHADVPDFSAPKRHRTIRRILALAISTVHSFITVDLLDPVPDRLFDDKGNTVDLALAQAIAPLLNAAALVAFTTLQLYALFLWLPSYLHAYVGVSLYGARLTHVIALSFFSICVAFLGYATRWISAPKLVFVGIGTLVLFSYPLFVILQNGDFVSLLLVQLAFALMAGCLLGGIYIVLPDLFKDNWQSLGMTVCFTLPVAIFGGTAPLVCGYLIGATHLLTAPALYIVAMGLIALPVAYRLAFTGNNLSSTNVDGSLKNS